MNEPDERLQRPTGDGSDSVSRDEAIELTRERLDSSFTPSDDEIWSAWQQVGGGPTVGDDLGRVVAQLEGIAVDG